MLEPLDECEEGLEEDSLDGDDDPQHLEGADGTLLQPTATVILTNMENLTIHSASSQLHPQQEDQQQEQERGTASSLLGEAPSAPTV